MRKSLKPVNTRDRIQTPTGVRRFFFKLELLGKRRPNPFHHNGIVDPVDVMSATKSGLQASSSHSPGKENPLHTPKLPILIQPPPKRTALVNEDTAESAVIISTFDAAPFCCHEDLVTMSRERLVEVATALNAKLPDVLAIDINSSLPINHIRQSIELIVGLRGDVPKAPRALRLMTDSECNRRLPAEFDMQIEASKTPQTSPLASRGRSQGQLNSLISPLLARLEEEDEPDTDVDKVDRSFKKRKLSFSQLGSEDDSDIVIAVDQSPTLLPGLRRVQSHSLPQTTSPPPVRILRSQSHNLQRSTVVDTAFTGDKQTRLRYRARRDSKDEKVRPQSLIPKPIGVPRRSERLRPAATYQTFVPVTSQDGAGSSRSSIAVGYRSVSIDIGLKRKRGMEEPEAEQQIMSGIRKMNMTGVEPFEMDVGV